MWTIAPHISRQQWPAGRSGWEQLARPQRGHAHPHMVASWAAVPHSHPDGFCNSSREQFSLLSGLMA
jgi:hypothetical protein